VKSGANLAAALAYIQKFQLKAEDTLVILLEDDISQTPSLLNEYKLVALKVLPALPKTSENSSAYRNRKFEDMEYFRPMSYFDKRLTIGDCYDLLKGGKIAIPLREGGELVGVVDRGSLLKNFVGKDLCKNHSGFNCMT